MNLFRAVYQFLIRNWVWIYPVFGTIYNYLKRTIKMERIGIFTPDQEKFIFQAFKSRIEIKNKFWNWLLKLVFKFGIKLIDNFGIDRIQEEWKKDLIPVIDAGINLEYEKTRRLVTDLLNKRIDFKNIDSETELRWFDSLTIFIASTIDCFVQKRRVQSFKN